MIYTENDITTIHENIEKVRTFLLEIAPKVGNHFDVIFDKGDRYSLTLYYYGGNPSITGWIGCNYCIDFEKPTKHNQRTIFDKYEIILDFCVAVLREWQNIKSQIFAEIDRQAAIREIITTFEI